MKVALLAAAASLVLAFAAHAGENPLAKNPKHVACDGLDGLVHTTSFTEAQGPTLCPKFLSTIIVKLPRSDVRT